METTRPGGPPPATEKPQLLEVALRRKYCPRYLVQPDGSVIEQDNKGVNETIQPGIVQLHHEDAVVALDNGVAQITTNTYKDLRRA